MPKKLQTIYVAVHDGVWAIERAEFRAFLRARSQGITDDEGDLNRMGYLLRHKMSSSLSAQARGGFPRGTVGHVCHDITWWTPEDYRDCLRALNGEPPPGA
jgi:hypothetical protein